MLHAYMLSHIDDVRNGNTQDVNDFAVLWDIIREDLYGDNLEREQHEFMTEKFIFPIRDALKEWDNGSNPDDQYYEDLAWGSLDITSTFNELFPEGSIKRNRVLSTNMAEDTNSFQNGISPKGSICN